MEEKIRQIKELIGLQKELNALLADYIALQDIMSKKNVTYWRPDWNGTVPYTPYWGGLQNAHVMGE
jgi:esterase/lipase superfamily enzyme